MTSKPIKTIGKKLEKEVKKKAKEMQKLKGVIFPSKKYFIKTKKIFQKYLDTTELNYTLLTTWTLGTYFHNKFETYPLLLLMARKQSGKTRTLKLISSLAEGSDGSTSTSITETFLFRHQTGSVFFDEMESISSREKTALRETINAVYKKGNKIIRYTEKKVEGKKQYVEESFFPFYPLGLANIYGFGDVLTDRSLQIILQRSSKSQTKLIEDFSTNQEILKLKKELSKLEVRVPKNLFSEWNNFIQKKECDSTLINLFKKIEKTKLSGRPLEIFFPLFIIAKYFGVLEELINAAGDYMAQQEGEFVDNIDDLLQNFMDIHQYEGFIPLTTLLSDFKKSLEEPEEWMNSKWFGRALKRLGLIARKRLINGRVQVELNNNTTNSTNTTNTTNSTNTTNNNLVELVELVELKELVEQINQFSKQDIEKAAPEFKEFLEHIQELNNKIKPKVQEKEENKEEAR